MMINCICLESSTVSIDNFYCKLAYIHGSIIGNINAYANVFVWFNNS